jgi:uncharacterized membrane-anchored protein YhcB (DUF1043 family)
MTLDGGWALILATILGVVISGVGVLVWRHVDSAQSDADEAKENCSRLEKDLLSYKAHVAEHYCKMATAERTESKIFDVLERLENKVDKLYERSGRE